WQNARAVAGRFESDSLGAIGRAGGSGGRPHCSHTALMAELTKLRPDRDLQRYYEQPTAIAAISGATELSLTVSGSWRQQFDWAVLEWNRDNVIEHPALRNLPDGDLSGLALSYEEVRTN